MDRISWKSTFGLALAAMVCLMAAPASAGIVYNVTNDLTHQNGWSVNGTITVSGTGTFTNASAISAWDITLSKPLTGSYQFTNALSGHDGLTCDASTLTATTSKLDLSPFVFQFHDTNKNNMLSWINEMGFNYSGKINGLFVFNSASYIPSNNSVVTIGTATPSGVPEIDPAGIGSVLALVTGALGLLERRRLKTA